MARSSGHRLQAAGLMVFVLNFLLMFPALSQSNDSIVLDQTGRKQRFNFTANGVYAILETNLRFETANGLLGLRLNLEDHLGLEKYKIMPVFSGSFNIKNRHNLFGMFYSLPRSSDFPDEGEEGIFNSDDTADIRWTRWRFIFSFSFPFLKDIEKKMDGMTDGEAD